MPPRLMHKKSRTGCKRCKVRKVKCDETRPVCGACSRHNLECIYVEPGPPAPRRDSTGLGSATHLSPDVSSDSPTSGRPSSAGVLDSDDGPLPTTEERRLLELRLMHRYMQSFSDIFAGIHNTTVAEVWRDLVPAMALHHPFLLHALYAVTTLHALITKSQAEEDVARASDPTYSLAGSKIPSLIPSAPPVTSDLDLEEMKKARRLYFNLAVRGQRMAVSNLNPDNADAVCMATILISNQGFLLDHDLELNDSEYTPPVQWMLLASSITTVVRACEGMLGPQTAMMRISESGRGLLLDRYKRPETGIFFKPLMDFQPDSELSDEESYQAASNFLGAIREGIVSCEPVSLLSRRFFVFATLVPSSFIGLVSQQRPRALVMLACFFAMTKDVEGIWWFRGAAEKHVRGLKTLIPPEWHWALEWSEDMINTQNTMRRRALVLKTTLTAPIPS